jgi:hypothetical protein
MTTITLPRAVVEQALEALEQSETTVPYEGFGMSRRVAERKHQATITALRAALAQQAWICPESPEHRYAKPGHCEDCGKPLVLAHDIKE